MQVHSTSKFQETRAWMSTQNMDLMDREKSMASRAIQTYLLCERCWSQMVPSTAVPDESVAVLTESGPVLCESDSILDESSGAGLCLRYAQGNMLARRRHEEEVGEGGGEVAT